MRQYVCAVPADRNGLLVLEKKDFHYLRNVLRLRAGDMISVSAQGVQMNMTLCRIDDGAKKIILQKCADSDSAAAGECGIKNASCRLSAEYCLLQFVPKPQKMELILRQAAECGVSCVVPVLGDYTQGGTEKSLQNTERYERIIREARQQSGSAVETKILPAMKLDAALGFWQERIRSLESGRAVSLVLYERNENTLPFGEAVFSEQEKNLEIKACALAVGSEGGISPAEYGALVKAGFKAVHFNTNILRCETAALYGIAALQSAVEN